MLEVCLTSKVQNHGHGRLGTPQLQMVYKAHRESRFPLP
jgi:hypothetical protein